MGKKFGDRKDGKRVNQMDSVHKIMPFLMDKRCDAEVYVSEKIDVTNLVKYLEHKNKGLDKENKTTLFHVFTTAMAKLVYERPLLNRFVQGKRYYDRNEVSLSFVAKTKFADAAEEMLIKLVVEENDNIDSIKDYILSKVSTVRKNKTNQIDKTLDILTKGPKICTSLLVTIIKWLDYHGWVPTSLTDNDPNYSTILLTNLGSIKCNQVYHHLNNYGTTSIVLAIGTLHQEEIIIDGKKQIRDIIEIGATCDERIADGFYFAKTIILLKHLINNPELLEKTMKEKIEFENK